MSDLKEPNSNKISLESSEKQAAILVQTSPKKALYRLPSKIGKPIKLESSYKPAKKKQPSPKPPLEPSRTPNGPDEKPRPDEIVLQKESQEKHIASLKKQAEEDIAAYKENAFQDIEKQKEAAKQEGYKAGLETAQQEKKDTLNALKSEFLGTINDAISEKNKIIQSSEKEILTLAIAIAEKVTQTTVENTPSVFQNILQEAMKKITDKEWVAIHVNPNDIELVRNYQHRFEKELRDIKKIEIKEDNKIEPGGLVIETHLGYIDSSISTKLALITDALNKTYDLAHPDTDPESANDSIDTPNSIVDHKPKPSLQ